MKKYEGSQSQTLNSSLLEMIRLQRRPRCPSTHLIPTVNRINTNGRSLLRTGRALLYLT
jgi:hypothetical protein